MPLWEAFSKTQESGRFEIAGIKSNASSEVPDEEITEDSQVNSVRVPLNNLNLRLRDPTSSAEHAVLKTNDP